MRDWFVARLAHSVVVGAVLLVGAGRSVHAQEIDCDSPSDREVRAVKFVGNASISEDELSARVITTPSTFFRRYFGWLHAGGKRCLPDNGLKRDVLALQQYYQGNGFYLTKVDTTVTPVGNKRVTVTFKIDEGRPSIVDSLSITGLDSVLNRDDVLANLQLRRGGRFGKIRWAADVDTITARLRNSGYLHATVLASFDAGPSSPYAQVAFKVVPGARVRIGTIAIHRVSAKSENQPADIDSAVVLRLLGFSAGNYYSDRALLDGQRNLYNLGAFRHIGIGVDTTGAATDSIATVAVDVREDLVHDLGLEYGWATLDCFRLSGQYTDKNFADNAWRLDLTGRVSKLGYGTPMASDRSKNFCWRRQLDQDSIGSSKVNYYLASSIRQPSLFRGNWNPAYSIYTERRGEFRAYLRTTLVGGDASATRLVGDRMPLRVGYSLEFGETNAEPAFLCVLFNACESSSQEHIQKRLPLAVSSVSFQRTRTDNVAEPRSGYAVATEARVSVPFLGSNADLTFYKLTGELSVYRPVTSHVTFATRFRAGFVTGGRTAGTNLPPPQERLYAGGANSVRGFQQNELGALIYLLDPSSVDSVVTRDSVAYFAKEARASDRRTIPLGGGTLGVANFELRIRDPFFPEALEYVPFVDVGGLFTEGGTNVDNSKKVYYTPGLGVRYLSPIGSIQGNVGYNAERTRKGQAYFTPLNAGNQLVCVTALKEPKFFVPRDTTAGTPMSNLSANCPATFAPFRSNNFFSKLVLTLSIQSSF
jgi:outer membrane protein insertion porin family/translocation and assembly module TamA